MADINVEQYLPRFPQQPLQQIWGLVPKYNNATSVDVLPGACMDDTDSVRIDWTLTKNKVLVGAVANTLYSVFAIKNPGTGATDVHLDTSRVSPTLPSGFTYKRWLGWCVTDGTGALIDIDWIGNGIGPVEMWIAARGVVATGLTATTYTAQSLSGWIPAGVECVAFLGATSNTASVSFTLSVNGIHTYSGFFSHSGEATDGDAWGLGLHNPGSFVPIVNNQIYYKASGGINTMYLKAIRYWR